MAKSSFFQDLALFTSFLPPLVNQHGSIRIFLSPPATLKRFGDVLVFAQLESLKARKAGFSLPVLGEIYPSQTLYANAGQ